MTDLEQHLLAAVRELQTRVQSLEHQRAAWERAYFAQTCATAWAAIERMAVDDPVRIWLETPLELGRGARRDHR